MPTITAAWLTDADRAEREETLAAFAERLRVVREQAGISQAQLDAIALLPTGMVSRLERATKVPSLFVLLQLAEALDVAPGVLLDTLPTPRWAQTVQRVIAATERRPGIKGQGIAQELDIASSYAQRLLRRLEETKQVVKHRGGWARPFTATAGAGSAQHSKKEGDRPLRGIGAK